MNTPSPKSSPESLEDLSIERHDTFYFADDPMVIFLVEKRLFKVHRYYFTQESEVFRDMFSVPSDGETEVEGMNDEHPIPLAGVTAKEFELLLKHFYTSYVTSDEEDSERILEENLTIMSIARRFAFDNVFKIMVQRIEPTDISVVQRIYLGDKYDLDEWLFSAYEELLDRYESLNLDELDALGRHRVIKFIRARDFMRQERLDILRADLQYRNQRIGRLDAKSKVQADLWPLPVSRTPKNAAQVATSYFNDFQAIERD